MAGHGPGRPDRGAGQVSKTGLGLDGIPGQAHSATVGCWLGMCETHPEPSRSPRVTIVFRYWLTPGWLIFLLGVLLRSFLVYNAPTSTA